MANGNNSVYGDISYNCNNTVVTTGLDLDNCCFKPINWCISQWNDLKSPLEEGRAAVGEVVKRFFLLIPLLLITLCASLVAVPGLFVWKTTTSHNSNSCSGSPQIEGSGQIETRRIDLGGTAFKTLKLEAIGTVRVVISEGEQYLKITADDNLIDYFSPREEEDSIIFGCSDNVSITCTEAPICELHISVEELNRIVSSGSVTLELDSVGEKKELTCEISGSGTVSIKEGYVDALKIMVSASGTYDGSNCLAKHSDVKISGSGEVYVKTASLNVNISGSGECFYYGETNISQNISGTGKVKRISE